MDIKELTDMIRGSLVENDIGDPTTINVSTPREAEGRPSPAMTMYVAESGNFFQITVRQIS